MKIELRRPYKSIQTLQTEELPDFALLIGRNGAGKTQLLEALRDGQALIPGIGADGIALYDQVSFSPPNVRQANRQSSESAHVIADAYFLPQPGGRPHIEIAKEIFSQHVGEIERKSSARARDDFVRDLRDEVRQLPDSAVYAADDRGSPYKEDLYAQVMEPLSKANAGIEGGRGSREFRRGFGDNQASVVSAVMKAAGKLPHELTRGDIMRAAHSEGETLSNSISEVFAAYKVDQFIWAHKRIEKEHIPFDELIVEYRTNNPPPWETLREILSQMRDATGDEGLFNFKFSDPDSFDLRVENYAQFSFTAVMTNLTTGARYELDSLSSGEKILMALCLVSFNQYLGRRPPKLLLFDELDAMLHPSMVAALVRTLKTLFVLQGTKVLMTSHSPMTVAALDETDIFRVIRTGGDVNVSRTTKAEAISELSEGLATVDVGLRIAAYDEAKVTILTEGHNSKHLLRWAQLHFPEDVHVFEELESYSSDSQLLTYGRLLGKMQTNTHFVIVWDCDAAGKAEALRSELPSDSKVTPFAFAKRENAIARNGIENNYCEETLEPYSTTTKGNDGTVLSRGFQSNRKAEFANHVLQYGTSQYFTNFQGLHDIVSRILIPTNEQA